MPDFLSRLRQSLASPQERYGVNDVAELWRHMEYRIRCRRPRDLEDVPDLAVRIRGAFGRALAAMPAPINGRPDPFGRPPPFDVYFGELGIPGDKNLPRPFVIGAEVVGLDVLVSLSVFGCAGFWAHQARDALVMALTNGVSIKSEGRMRVAFEPYEIESVMIDGLDVQAVAREAVLILLSPLVVRSGQAVAVSATSFLSALTARVDGLARWQGCRLDCDIAAMRAAGDRVTLIADGLTPVQFTRHSQRQHGRDIPVSGVTGHLVLQGDLEPWMPYLAIAEVGHVGSHAGLGLGRFRMAVYP